MEFLVGVAVLAAAGYIVYRIVKKKRNESYVPAPYVPGPPPGSGSDSGGTIEPISAPGTDYDRSTKPRDFL